MTRPILRGAFTALVTPFTRDGTLDEEALRRLVRWQVLAGKKAVLESEGTAFADVAAGR